VSDTELKALRLQMNPHFIFNSLNSIGDYMHKNETSTAQDYLTRFAALMRMTLENSEFPEIALSEDLKFIELYLQVESKRLPGRFSYAIEVDESIDIENTLVPPLILQPLIENSIWHGFKSKDRTGHILIEIKKEDEMIVCSVDDNGLGRNMNGIVNKNKRSLGIRNTKDRISIINTKKRSDGALKIIDKANDGGTRVEVRLPLQTAF
jgi:LytS/YehU family sensor histidine kinase